MGRGTSVCFYASLTRTHKMLSRLLRTPLVLSRSVKRVRSRLVSTEVKAAETPKPVISMTMQDVNGAGAIVLSVIGATFVVSKMLESQEGRSDVALAKYEGRADAALAKLEERMAGTAAKLEERIAGVMKEVDAKVSGAKEMIEKEVDAKMAGSEKAVTKEVDAKITGFKEAADLKVRATACPTRRTRAFYVLTAYLLSPPSPFVVLQEVVIVVIKRCYTRSRNCSLRKTTTTRVTQVTYWLLDGGMEGGREGAAMAGRLVGKGFSPSLARHTRPLTQLPHYSLEIH